jgi:hypothetical protein
MTEIVTKDSKFTLELTVEEANLIIAGLQELPAKLANPITQKIQEQAKNQLNLPPKEA